MVTVDDFIPARIQHEGRARKVRLVVIHATQSPERDGAARSVARYFASDAARGSAHVTCDDAETIGSVHPEDTAAGAPGANEDGFHIEQVGYSEQGTAQWGDDYSDRVIARAAKAAIEACDHFGVPKVWLSIADVQAGKAGITDHDTITKATGKGSHWDPGPNYPRERFMQLVNQEDDMTPEEHALLVRISSEVREARELARFAVLSLEGSDRSLTAHGRTRSSIRTLVKDLAADLGAKVEEGDEPIDVDALAAELGPKIAEAMPPSAGQISVEDVTTAVRAVFADAGEA